MSIKKLTKEVEKKQQTQAHRAIAKKIDLALGEYKKNGLDEKKYERRLKKASALLSKLVVVPTVKEPTSKKSPAKSVASVK